MNKTTKNGKTMEIKIGDKLELNYEHDYITVEVIDIDADERGLMYVFTLGGSAGFDSYAYSNQVRKVNGKRI
jgi:endonuclease YncB( thermonuclease family)|tara:strand:+ start:211 stop:426 length:216 start_codon:yes stop_codon:yes gene_type:complete